MNESPSIHFSSDHDLLIRISEQILQLDKSLTADRTAWNARAATQDLIIEALRKDVESLGRSRAMFMGVAAAMSVIITTIERIFWK